MAVVAIFCSCTKNNGDIGFWFGQWKVDSIHVGDTIDTTYAGNLFFSFQSDVIDVNRMDAHHVDNHAYGRWTEDSDSTITIYFTEESYPPVDGYMQQGANVLGYSHRRTDRLNLTLNRDSLPTVVYYMEKW